MSSSMPAFPPSQLRQFLLVAELGSYTAAAMRANRTQSALSLAIKQMEQRLGQALFEPTARTTLTPFGRQCVPFVRALLEHHDNAAATMMRLAHGQAGRLTIACVGAAFRVLLSDLLPRFAQAYPDIGISVLDYHSANVARAVLSSEADFGLGSAVSHDDRLTFQPLFRDTFGVVCPASHPLAKRKSVAWEELQGLPLIGSPAHELLSDLPQAALLRASKHQASHMVPTIGMLEQGLGITVLGASAFDPAKHDLRYVPLTTPSLTFELGLTKLADRTLLPPAALMEEMILATFAPSGGPGSQLDAH